MNCLIRGPGGTVQPRRHAASDSRSRFSRLLASAAAAASRRFTSAGVRLLQRQPLLIHQVGEVGCVCSQLGHLGIGRLAETPLLLDRIQRIVETDALGQNILRQRAGMPQDRA